MGEVKWPCYGLLARNEYTTDHLPATTKLLESICTVKCTIYSQITTQLFADQRRKQNNAKYRHVLATFCFSEL
jgi:hypothetical protein